MQIIQNNLRIYRNELKGLAILWVVFFHAQLGLSGFLYDVQKIGYGGVDIFFFLSGFGLYHSLERSGNLGGYLRRRAQRLLPAYVPFCLLWLVIMIPLSNLGLAGAIRTAMGNLFMVGFFSGAPVNINWYVSALFLSIVIAPVLHALLREGKNFVRRTLFLIAAAFCMGLAFVGSEQYMVVSRLPVFILGMIFAGWRCERACGRKIAIGLFVAFVLGLAVLMITFRRLPELLSTYAMYWHPFVLITPALCAGLAWLFGKCPHSLLAPIRVLGKASFEIFLFNAWIELLGKRYGLCSSAAEWLAWSVGSIALGILYHLVVCRAGNKISEKAQKKG